MSCKASRQIGISNMAERLRERSSISVEILLIAVRVTQTDRVWAWGDHSANHCSFYSAIRILYM